MESYFAILLKAKEGGYIALFPDIPEAVTQGEDIAECIEMAKDVLNSSLEEYVRERRNFPAPSSLAKIREKAKTEIAENSDTLDLSFEPLFQLVFADDMSQKPVKITVSFPKGYLDTIDKKAEKLGMTRSGFLVRAGLAYEG